MPRLTANRVSQAQAKSGITPWAQPERAGERAPCEERPGAAWQRGVGRGEREGQGAGQHDRRDQQIAGVAGDDHGHQHHGQHHADRLREADPARHQAALRHRDVVRHARGDAGLHGVQARLRQAPGDDDPRDGGLAGQQHQRDGTGQRAAHGPRVPPPEPAGGAVRQRPGDRVGDHRHRRADAGDPAEHGDLVGGPGDRLHLVGQQHRDRAEVPQVQPEVGQRDQSDPAPADPPGRLGGEGVGAADAARQAGVAGPVDGRNLGHDAAIRSGSTSCRR